MNDRITIFLKLTSTSSFAFRNHASIPLSLVLIIWEFWRIVHCSSLFSCLCILFKMPLALQLTILRDLLSPGQWNDESSNARAEVEFLDSMGDVAVCNSQSD